MSYKHPVISFKYHLSTFEQYEQSRVTFHSDYRKGWEPKIKLLDNSDQVKFLKLARDKINSEIEKLIVKSNQ